MNACNNSVSMDIKIDWSANRNSGLTSPRSYSVRANKKFTVDELDWDEGEKPTKPIHGMQVQFLF